MPADTNTTSHPAVLPHGPAQELFEDVYWVQGSFDVGRGIRFSRNMVILRQGGELTLVNPIRLDADGEAALEALGAVRHVIHLAAFHGMDNAYVVERFGASLWCPAGKHRAPGPSPDHVFEDGAGLPVNGATGFVFADALFAEGAVLFDRHGGLLITCDAIQDWTDMNGCTLPARLVMPFMGFRRTTIIGPLWLKAMTPKGGFLRPDFDRLVGLEFDHFIGGDGGPRVGGAKSRVQTAMVKAFGD